MVDFDRIVSRAHTQAVKYDARRAVFGADDVTPLWVADMDFPAPEAVTDALIERARHPIYGYTLYPESLYDALIQWYSTRFDCLVERSSIVMAPGVVPSLHVAALAFAAPGDGIIVQPPVYAPFFSSVELTGRRLIENPLRLRDGRYEMDLEHLEACARDGAKMLFLCSPHNPVGRVWQREELQAVLAIARRYQLVVVSDEIHCDLVYPDQAPHTMLATLATEADQLITAVAPSKTFNVPGLGLSSLIVPDPTHRAALKAVFNRLHMIQCNPFSIAAFEAAYRHGSEWLEQLLGYVAANRDFVRDYVAGQLPGIRLVEPEGTYLLWLDCRELGLTDEALKTFFIKQAKIGLSAGVTFGTGGSGFMRMNIGAPRAVLMSALDRLRVALSSLDPAAG
ncbi:MalY/PatB family protein [Marinobacter caseinilyticus]|uniref:MalY/PatB family protein n=1 Tax=Marinobacter caseinilyticus TaxID=2692195 RepID=UPI00140D7D76|nr:PatB family C-S lyase [Marinobacter caseinilyticus]